MRPFRLLLLALLALLAACTSDGPEELDPADVKAGDLYGFWSTPIEGGAVRVFRFAASDGYYAEIAGKADVYLVYTLGPNGEYALVEQAGTFQLSEGKLLTTAIYEANPFIGPASYSNAIQSFRVKTDMALESKGAPDGKRLYTFGAACPRPARADGWREGGVFEGSGEKRAASYFQGPVSVAVDAEGEPHTVVGSGDRNWGTTYSSPRESCEWRHLDFAGLAGLVAMKITRDQRIVIAYVENTAAELWVASIPVAAPVKTKEAWTREKVAPLGNYSALQFDEGPDGTLFLASMDTAGKASVAVRSAQGWTVEPLTGVFSAFGSHFTFPGGVPTLFATGNDPAGPWLLSTRTAPGRWTTTPAEGPACAGPRVQAPDGTEHVLCSKAVFCTGQRSDSELTLWSRAPAAPWTSRSLGTGTLPRMEMDAAGKLYVSARWRGHDIDPFFVLTNASGRWRSPHPLRLGEQTAGGPIRTTQTWQNGDLAIAPDGTVHLISKDGRRQSGPSRDLGRTVSVKVDFALDAPGLVEADVPFRCTSDCTQQVPEGLLFSIAPKATEANRPEPLACQLSTVVASEGQTLQFAFSRGAVVAGGTVPFSPAATTATSEGRTFLLGRGALFLPWAGQTVTATANDTEVAWLEADGGAGTIRVLPNIQLDPAIARADGEGGLWLLAQAATPFTVDGLTSSTTGTHLVLARLDRTGRFTKLIDVGGPTLQLQGNLKLAPDGAPWLELQVAAGTDFGLGPINDPLNAGQPQAVLLRFDATGRLLAQRQATRASQVRRTRLAFLQDGSAGWAHGDGLSVLGPDLSLRSTTALPGGVLEPAVLVALPAGGFSLLTQANASTTITVVGQSFTVGPAQPLELLFDGAGRITSALQTGSPRIGLFSAVDLHFAPDGSGYAAVSGRGIAGPYLQLSRYEPGFVSSIPGNALITDGSFLQFRGFGASGRWLSVAIAGGAPSLPGITGGVQSFGVATYAY